MTSFFCRTLKIGEAATRGSEPTYSVTFTDPMKPFIKVDVKAITYDSSAGKKTRGYTASFEVMSAEAFGDASVDALLGKNVWLHAEPDGTIAAGNPALTVKDFTLLKDTTFNGDVSTGSSVRYYGEKECLLESDAWAKDTTA